MTIATLLLTAAVAALCGYAIARWSEASIPEAITRAGVVFTSTIMIGVALLGVLVPALT
ncbi:hypothetical protein ACFYVE_39155 [Streptomyces tendae]|uniref:hypothetical protein n=1 Tax=Streptomyces tendae TaxID=1932 RepID=UPI0036737301